jgi:exopolysaccharide biosynthesis polyprenyl glycosylphosphotransferase
MKKSELIFSTLLVPVDFLMILIAGIVAYFLRTSPLVAEWRPVLFSLNLPFSRFLIILIIAAIFTLVIFALSGLYKIRASRKLFEEFFQVAISTSAAVLAIVVFLFLIGKEFESRFILLATWISAILFVFIGRFFIKKLQRYLVGRYNIGTHNVLVIGGDGMSKNIIREISRQPDLGYRIIRHFPELDIEKIKRAIKNPGVDAVILASPKYERKEILDILDFCDEYRVGFKFVPNLFQALTTNIEIDTFGGVPLIEIKKTPLDGWGKIIKRGVDILGSMIGLIVFSPLFLFVGLIIKLDSSGPAFAKLKRVSQGKEFYLCKFRSMVKDAEVLKEKLMKYNERKDGPLFKIKDDPRITRIGKILRKIRLDEFPQLINVFRGEMSLVGPRPHQPDEIAKYEKHHKKVLLIKSGITGLAQVSGSSDLSFKEEVKLDVHYIENWSLKKDTYILLKTFLVLFKDRSAC